MARELKEIIAELREWQKESPERSVVVVAGHDDMVSTSITGKAKDTITALANAIVSHRTFGKVMLEAMTRITSYTLMGEGMEEQD
jgi:hypothetical protein